MRFFLALLDLQKLVSLVTPCWEWQNFEIQLYNPYTFNSWEICVALGTILRATDMYWSKCSLRHRIQLNIFTSSSYSRFLRKSLGNHWFLPHIYFEDTAPWDDQSVKTFTRLPSTFWSCEMLVACNPRLRTTDLHCNKCFLWRRIQKENFTSSSQEGSQEICVTRDRIMRITELWKKAK